MLIAELEKLGILDDEECEHARKYLFGKNIENARQDLVEENGIWPMTDFKAYQRLQDARNEARNNVKNIPKFL